MNIVVVSQLFKNDGLATQSLGFARCLQGRGHRVAFVVGADSRTDMLQDVVDGRILRVRIPQIIRAGDALRLVDEITRFCRDQGCELLHLHPVDSHVLGALVGARLKLPFVVSIHGPASLKLAHRATSSFLLGRLVLSAACRVFCPAPETIEEVRQIQPEAQCSFLANGVDLDRFRRARRDPEGEWAAVVRLDEDRAPGIRMFLDRFISAVSRPVLVFGDGSDRHSLERWVDDRGFSGSVRVEGHSDSLAERLNNGFAGVAGMSRVVLEAGALGLPVILVGCDGVKGLVSRGQMDSLAERNFSGRGLASITADRLAAQLGELAAQPEDYDLRWWVEANANEESIWDDYLRQVGDLKSPDYQEHDALLSLLQQRPDQPLYSLGLLQELISGDRAFVMGASSFLRLAELEQMTEEAQTTIDELTDQITQKQREIDKITGSLGWRLLSRYGRFKYRYLLPVYRLLGLHSPGSGESSRADQTTGRSRNARRMAGGKKADFWGSLTLLPEPEPAELGRLLERKLPQGRSCKADVICFSIIDWHFRYQRPQQMMSQFAAHGHRVFYISVSRFRPANAVPRVSVRAIKENVYEVELAIERPPEHYDEAISGKNQDALLFSLEELRETFGISQAISYVMIASWGGPALEARARWGWPVLYDCMDDWDTFPLIKQPVLQMEARLVKECDLVVVTAQRLLEKWRHYNRHIVVTRNGVDYDFYERSCRPNSLLTGISHPVVGYYGAIADWFDVDLMASVAQRRPEYTFVLLGGVFDVEVSSLKALPNVKLLGQQPYEQMPQYLHHFDACVIPFKINAVTESTDPVKLYEYLSVGKPVVSVALPEIEQYREHLYVAADAEDFVGKLDRALNEDDPEVIARRKEFARGNTWAQRYGQVQAGISQALPRASIIVVTYNNLVLNKLCLASIIKNTAYPNYEIVVVDNNSTDGTPEFLSGIASGYPQLKLVLNTRNNGFARANNQGIEVSSGEFIVLLNNDTIVPPGWLGRLVSHLQDPAVGLVGPMTNAVGNEARLEVSYRTWSEMEEFAGQHASAHRGRIADIKMLAMFCLAMRRETYDDLGPLDEQFGIGMFEDDDYSQRAKEKGYRVICAADVFVHHFGQAAFKELIKTGDYDDLFEANRRRFERKWNTPWEPHRHRALKFEPHVNVPRYTLRTAFNPPSQLERNTRRESVR